ncbi:MAG TPA: hypothetical protein PK156_00045 [Polyangium sp.]|nr:hypothetical protein [Polyangium sp.]
MITALGKTPLAHTQVTARLEQPLVDGTNVLFCSTFQLAWSELRNSFGGTVRLDGDPQLALDLERPGPVAEEIDGASCVVGSGVGAPFLAKLDKELRQKFGNRDDFMLPERLDPDAVLAYAYLSKDLEFGTPFAVNRNAGIMFRGGERVAHFGIWADGDDKVRNQRAKQVIVHHYGDGGAFVLELLTKVDSDRLIIARIPRGQTLLETADTAMTYANQKPGFFTRIRGKTEVDSAEVVRIPIIQVDLIRSFVELAGRKIIGKTAFIEDAKQRIRMSLDEKGAVLRSAGVVLTQRSAPQGRRFICDQPFLVAMIRKGCRYPYFALWLEDPELFVKTP